MRAKFSLLFIAAFFALLFIKIYTLFFVGVFDMNQYNEWGIDTLNRGLFQSYKGTYFPVQYLIFSICSQVSLFFDIDYFIVFKTANLLFDIGNFVVILSILKKTGAGNVFALIYWIHPCFLNMFSLGYIDFQFAFFVLVSVFFMLNPGIRNLIFSSLFLGVAFLMKPQVQIIILALFVYSMFMSFKYKRFDHWVLFLFPLLFYGLFSFYFWFHLPGEHRLTMTYLNVSNVMPCLNAQFLNIWFVVAYLLKSRDAHIFSISDQIGFLGVELKYLAAFTILLLIIVFVYRLVNLKIRPSRGMDYLFLISFASFIVPALMTSAHENHFFLSSVLLVILSGMIRSVTVKISVHIILLLQFVNLYGYYGFGPEKLNIQFYNYDIAFYLSIVSFLISVLLIVHFLKLQEMKGSKPLIGA